jgi:transposase
LTDDEDEEIRRLAHARTAPARVVERARIIWLASQGYGVAAIAAEVGVHVETVRLWLAQALQRGRAGGLG